MKSILFIWVTISLFISIICTAKESNVFFPLENNVNIVTNITIDEAIHHFSYLLINFYKSNEDASRSFHDTFSYNISKILNEQIPHVQTAMIDINYYPDIESKYNLTSYPTLLFFSYSRIRSLKYITNAKLIVSWVNKDLTFPSTLLGTISEIKTLINQTDFVSIIYFGSNKTEIIEFETVAFTDHKRFYGKCANKLAYQYFNVTPGSIVLFKSFDEMKMVYNGSFTNAQITKFINDNSHQYIVFQCDAKAYHKTVNELYPTLYYFRSTEFVLNDDLLLKYSSRKYKGIVQLVVCGIKSKDEQMVMKEFNITKNDAPVVLLVDYRKEKRIFKMKTITSGMIDEFISGWYLGKMMIHNKSQPIDHIKESPVYQVAARSFYTDVIMTDLDVFVMFYGANCNYCDYAFPIYTDLAKKLKHNAKLLIASYDLSKNDFDLFEFEQLPTLILFPAKNKFNFVKYKGMNSLEEYENFLINHAKYRIKLDEKINIKNDL